MSKVIRIEEGTYRQLAERGKLQGTMDDIILRLLHAAYCATEEAGKQVQLSQSQPIPDLIVNECPLGCGNCAGVYVNEMTGYRIVCRCRACRHGSS